MIPEELTFFSVALGDKDRNGSFDVTFDVRFAGIQIVKPEVHNINGASAAGLMSAIKGLISLARKLIPGL